MDSVPNKSIILRIILTLGLPWVFHCWQIHHRDIVLKRFAESDFHVQDFVFLLPSPTCPAGLCWIDAKSHPIAIDWINMNHYESLCTSYSLTTSVSLDFCLSSSSSSFVLGVGGTVPNGRTFSSSVSNFRHISPIWMHDYSWIFRNKHTLRISAALFWTCSHFLILSSDWSVNFVNFCRFWSRSLFIPLFRLD